MQPRPDQDGPAAREGTSTLPRHALVATLHEADLAGILEALPRAPPEARLVEVRLDALWHGVPEEAAATDALLALTQAAHAADRRLVATLRPKRQGGAFEGPEEVRLGLLVAAARAGFAAVDLEHDLADPRTVLALLRETGCAVLLSEHRLPTAPGRDDGLRLLLSMQDRRVDAHKTAFHASSFPDALRALELAHVHCGRGGSPSVCPLGYGGPPLRALLALAGNTLTYGHAGARPAAPGQPAAHHIAAVWRHWGLDPDDLGRGHAPWHAVLGTPVDHSLSPRLHNAALLASGRPERFGALDVPASAGAFRLTCTVAPRIGLAGASITHPHKEHAGRIGEPDDVVRAVGAANCLRFTGQGAHATNTDATAFLRILESHAGAAVAVLGSGGAARAALWAAREHGCTASFTTRDPERGTAVAKDLDAAFVPWADRGSLRADAWVQATPLGSRPGDEAPVDGLALQDASLLVELAYGAGETPLTRAAQEHGSRVVDGPAFLLEQAADAYRYWFGEDPDRSAMEAALGRS